MRILSVSPYYSPEGGGLERYAHQVLAHLVRRGHEAHALAFTRLGTGTSTQDGVHVERLLPAWRAGNAPVHPGFSRRVAERIRTLRPDVVLAHTPVPFPAEAAFAAARRERVPFAVVYHAGSLRGSTPLLDLAARVDRLTFERRMLAGADRVVGVSPYVLDHALRRHRAKATVIPPGVDTGLFEPGPGPRGNEVLFVGPLASSYAWKGLDVLWKAFQQVRRRVPEATLRLVGSGDRLAEFEGHAAGSRGAVRVDARLTDEGLRDAYRGASVLALPSLTDAESFGMVMAEANACATPVVASRVGGIPAFVRDGENGFLCTPGDEGELAEHLTLLLSAPALAARMGERGREIVMQDHAWPALAGRMERVLDEAAQTRVVASAVRS